MSIVWVSVTCIQFFQPSSPNVYITPSSLKQSMHAARFPNPCCTFVFWVSHASASPQATRVLCLQNVTNYELVKLVNPLVDVTV